MRIGRYTLRRRFFVFLKVKRLQQTILDSLEDKRKLESIIRESSDFVAVLQEGLKTLQCSGSDLAHRVDSVAEESRVKCVEIKMSNAKETREIRDELMNVVENVTNMQNIQQQQQQQFCEDPTTKNVQFCEYLHHKHIQLEWSIQRFEQCRNKLSQLHRLVLMSVG